MYWSPMVRSGMASLSWGSWSPQVRPRAGRAAHKWRSHSPLIHRLKEPPARRLSAVPVFECVRWHSSPPRIRPRVPPWPRCTGGRSCFRSLEFSTNLRLSWHCPDLTAQGRSPAGETGAYLTAHSDPACSGGSAETPGITALRRPASHSQVRRLVHVHLPGIEAG